MSNCNIDFSCASPLMIPIFFFTGNENKKDPQMCVNSHLVFHPIMKDGNRGYNLAEYDPLTGTVVTSHAFDGYVEEPSRLIIFLDQISDRNLLLGVIHDDASVRELAYHFKKFGIYNVPKLRSIGWFIGQRNASFAFQDMSHSPDGKQYPPPMNYRMCIPNQSKILCFFKIILYSSNIFFFQVVGLRVNVENNRTSTISPKDKRLVSNREIIKDFGDRRKEFCKTMAGYNDFCSQRDAIFSAIPDLSNELVVQHSQSIEKSQFENIPIVVMCGADFNSARMSLETLSNQPGLRRDFVTVLVPNALESEEISKLVNYVFQFRLKLVEAINYDDFYEKSLSLAAEQSKQHKSDAFIFIEPDVTLSPDFLSSFANLYNSVFATDLALSGISAWNPYGMCPTFN